MCIIIVNNYGKIKESRIRQASRSNPDGAGIMYAKDGQLHTHRSLQNEEVIQRYFRLRKQDEAMPIVLHFRIATDGGITTDNCHPYGVNENTALMHNGILTSYSNRNTAMSDTRLFIEDILKHIPTELLFTDEILKLIQQAIGFGNKFVLMNSDGLLAIINERAGHWQGEKQNWFSNDSYLPREPIGYTASTYQKPKYAKPVESSGKRMKRRYSNDVVFCGCCGSPVWTKYEKERGVCYTCYANGFDRAAQNDDYPF